MSPLGGADVAHMADQADGWEPHGHKRLPAAVWPVWEAVRTRTYDDPLLALWEPGRSWGAGVEVWSIAARMSEPRWFYGPDHVEGSPSGPEPHDLPRHQADADGDLIEGEERWVEVVLLVVAAIDGDRSAYAGHAAYIKEMADAFTCKPDGSDRVYSFLPEAIRASKPRQWKSRAGLVRRLTAEPGGWWDTLDSVAERTT